jgi:hypothetical protein
MSDTVLPTEPADTKPCKVCGEEIKKTALKCIHCDSYQDWRGSLNLSQTVLALLIALITVATAMIPVISDALLTKNSAMVIVFQGATDKAITFLVSNTGTRPGSISRTMTLALENGPDVTLLAEARRSWWRMSSEDENSSAVLIEPSKSLLLHYVYRPENQNQAFATAMKKANLTKDIENGFCGLFGNGTDFLAKERPIHLTVGCSEISAFLFHSIPVLP